MLGCLVWWGDKVAAGQLKLISLSVWVVSLRMVKLLLVSKVESKIHVEKFGSLHWTHSQFTPFNPLKTASGIPIHSWWYHISHEWQHTHGVDHLQALLQIPQGNFIVLGPGLGSGAYDSARSRLHRYRSTSLFLHTGPCRLFLITLIDSMKWEVGDSCGPSDKDR